MAPAVDKFDLDAKLHDANLRPKAMLAVSKHGHCQDTLRVDHTLDGGAFVRLGKDVENVVLARAVHWHCEHRVLLNGRRTVVFRHGT